MYFIQPAFQCVSTVFGAQHNLLDLNPHTPTQTDCLAFVAQGPLYPLDPVTGEKLLNATEATGHWLVEADIYVTHGVTLQV